MTHAEPIPALARARACWREEPWLVGSRFRHLRAGRPAVPQSCGRCRRLRGPGCHKLRPLPTVPALGFEPELRVDAGGSCEGCAYGWGMRGADLNPKVDRLLRSWLPGALADVARLPLAGCRRLEVRLALPKGGALRGREVVGS